MKNNLKNLSNCGYSIHDKLWNYNSKLPDKVKNINDINVKNNNVSNILNVNYNNQEKKLKKCKQK